MPLARLPGTAKTNDVSSAIGRAFEHGVHTRRIARLRDEEQMSDEDIDQLHAALTDRAIGGIVDGSKCVRYDGLLAAREAVDPKVAAILTPRLFMTLMVIDDCDGRCRIDDLVDFVTRCAMLDRCTLALSVYDGDNDGCLTPEDLLAYIDAFIDGTPALAKMDENFRPFYKCFASRRFFFFLDTQRIDVIRIDDIVVSGFLDDLLALASTGEGEEEVKRNGNCLSMASAQRLYGQYVNLDVDHDGLISKEELKEYANGSLTSPFLDALFDRVAMYDGGKMDFKAYVDFVLAMENKEDRASLLYFMRVLCIFSPGRLDARTIAHFFTEIGISIEHLEGVAINTTDIIDELFDMCRPHDPSFITVEEVIASKQGATIVDILTDVDAFWRYDNRESLADEEEEWEQGTQANVFGDTPRMPPTT